MSMSGFLLVNKPSGPTSHDIVDQLRRLTGKKTIGHAGTLDPFATGLLILGVGKEATRRMLALTHLDKWYEAEIALGVETDTYDRTGHVTREASDIGYRISDIGSVLTTFIGPQEQVPPMFSAKKIGGKKLYELARAGKEVERPTARVSVYRMELLNKELDPDSEAGVTLAAGGAATGTPTAHNPDAKVGVSTGGVLAVTGPAHLRLVIRCSSGTYIRSLTHDLGEKLGCGAHLKELNRLAVGPFHLAESRIQNSESWQKNILSIPQVLEILNKHKSNPVNVIMEIPHLTSPCVAEGGNVSPLSKEGGSALARQGRDRDKEGGLGLHDPQSTIYEKKVLAFGTFDPLHEGHFYFLTEAKKYGDNLTVVVTRDEHIRHFKHREPKQPEAERLAAVAALPCVNEARLSDEHLDWACLDEVTPDVVILGHDQSELKTVLQKQTSVPLIQLREMVLLSKSSNELC